MCKCKYLYTQFYFPSFLFFQMFVLLLLSSCFFSSPFLQYFLSLHSNLHKNTCLSLFSTTAVRRMGLTAAPSLSNTLPAMPAVSPAWTGQLSPHCPCHHRSRPDLPTPPNPERGNTATAPPAHPTTHPSTSVPLMRCATAASASPTCQRTMRTRRWRCRCPPSEAPC